MPMFMRTKCGEKQNSVIFVTFSRIKKISLDKAGEDLLAEQRDLDFRIYHINSSSVALPEMYLLV